MRCCDFVPNTNEGVGIVAPAVQLDLGLEHVLPISLGCQPITARCLYQSLPGPECL